MIVNFDSKEYVIHISEKTIDIFCDSELLRSMRIDREIDNAIYVPEDDLIYYGFSGSSPGSGSNHLISLPHMKFLKYCGNHFALVEDKEKNMAIMNMNTGQRYKLPLQHIDDIYIRVQDGEVIAWTIGETVKYVSVFSEDDDTEYVLMNCAKLKEDREPEIMYQLSVLEIFDNFYELYKSNPRSSNGIVKFPLELFLMKYPQLLAICNQARELLYYYEKYNLFIVADIDTGDVIKLFEGGTIEFCEENSYYFNTKESILSIIGKEAYKRYYLEERGDIEDRIHQLNLLYNQYFIQNKNVINDSRFNKLFWSCLSDCELIETKKICFDKESG